MSKTVTIDNGILKVEISTLGAEIISVKKDGKERIWQGGDGFWSGHAPILFPYCGRLVDGYYTIGDKKIENALIHGYVKRNEFEVVSSEKTSTALLLKSNEETKKTYPFDVDFRVLFKLNKDVLEVYFMIENNESSDVYYSVGCHEAFSLDGEFTDYAIEFTGDENAIECMGLVNNFSSNVKYTLPLQNNNVLPLKYELFDEDEKDYGNGVYSRGSVLIENAKSKRVNLLYKGEQKLSLYYNDFKNLVLWTEPNAKFIAIEPWNGLPDDYDTNHKFEEKRDILKLEKNGAKTFYHSITFND